MATTDRIIRYNGDMETLAWKYPSQKLTTSISVLQINAYLKELSQYVRGELNKRTQEYGIQVVSFEVNAISVDERKLEPAQDPCRAFCPDCGTQLSRGAYCSAAADPSPAAPIAERWSQT